MNPALEYINNQQEPYRTILIHLQVVIENTVSAISLKYKYKLPFYYLHEKPFCYLNVTKEYVDVGFWKANELQNHKVYMVTDGRKVIKSLRYRKLVDIDDQLLIAVLKEAKDLY